MQREEKLAKAVLLAARWFKLSYDCQDDVPPSKADLAGMFDAMQEARLHSRSEDPADAAEPKL